MDKNKKSEILNYYLNNEPTYRELADVFEMFQEFDNERKANRMKKFVGKLKKEFNSSNTTEDVEEGFIITKKWWNGSAWGYVMEKAVQEDEDKLSKLINALNIPDRVSKINRINPELSDNKKYMLSLSIADFHYGKLAHLSLAEQEDMLFNAMISLLNDYYTKNITEVWIPILGDFFNSDTVTYTTTAGTPQHDSAEYQDTFERGWQLVTNIVNTIAQSFPVRLIVIPGNHDFQKSYYLGEILKAYYSSNPNVFVQSNKHSRQYCKFGNTLFGFEHGDNIKAERVTNLFLQEARELIADTSLQEWHTGHLHRTFVSQEGNTTFRTLPSLTPTDAWHKKKGFLSIQACQAHLYELEEGFKSYSQCSYF